MTEYKVKVVRERGRVDHIEVIGLCDSFNNEPDSYLICGGTVGYGFFAGVDQTRCETLRRAIEVALYDERQTNENIKDGDTFAVIGTKWCYRVRGVHVFKVDPVAEAIRNLAEGRS